MGEKMKFALLSLALVMIAGLVFAQAGTAGEFTCPAGQTENLQCAASCCTQNSGEYSYADESCTVETSSQWNQAAACEAAAGCCETNSSGGCCGSVAMIALGALAVVGFARSTKQ